MTREQAENNQDKSLKLQDLLINEQTGELSDYLSLSIKNLGEDTKVTVTTVEDNPRIYSSTLNGVAFTDLQYLGSVNIDSVNE